MQFIEAQATHQFHSSAEQVYDAWLDPKHVRAWMAKRLTEFGLEGDIRRIEIDPRVGGKFCFSDIRRGHEAIHWGNYLELDRPRTIAFTWSVGDEADDNPSRVRVSIDRVGKGCEVTIVHQMDPKWADYVARTSDGWLRMLKAIAELLGEPVVSSA